MSDKNDARGFWSYCWEGVFWFFPLFILWTYEACPDKTVSTFRNWVTNGYWWRHVLPNSSHEGWAGISFVSTCTGLNIALVKFESFIKSLDDVKKNWRREAEKKIEKEFTPAQLSALRADDDKSKELSDGLNECCQREIEQAHRDSEDKWIFWRKWAFRNTILGFLVMFWQFSGGVLAIVLIIPAIGTWWTHRKSTEKVMGKIDGAISCVQGLIEKQQRTKPAMAKKVRNIVSNDGAT